MGYSQTAQISLEKYTQGVDADTAPGPSLQIGSFVEWTYVVTNTGSVPLSDVYVIDDQNLTIRCPEVTDLLPGESFTCIAGDFAVAGQYQNEGIAFGTGPNGEQVSDSDLSHYFGGEFNTSIAIEKYTNGEDADNPPGVLLDVGDPVDWTYEVTNTGTTLLTGIVVSDSQGEVVTCPGTELMPGETMTCVASGTAMQGQYRNVGSVIAFGPNGETVTALDSSHYFGDGANAGLSLVLYVNGLDANDPPGPTVQVGSMISWTYEVTNTGDVTISSLQIYDDQGLSGRCDVNEIQPGETLVCTANAPAQLGQFANLGTVSGITPSGLSVQATDPSHYFGEASPLAPLVLEKRTNGFDADQAPGPLIPVGDQVDWTYEITNNTTEVMTNIQISDDQGVVIDCGQFPLTFLNPGQTYICSGQGVATQGQYVNVGMVTATNLDGTVTYSATDTSHYLGETLTPDIQINTLINSEDADDPPGPTVPIGSLLYVTFEVTNTGDVPLQDIEVDNSLNLKVRCPLEQLDPGESMVCLSRLVAEFGQNDLTGYVSAKTESGAILEASDPSHYTGEEGLVGITLQKLTNSEDADNAPGPSITEGDPVTWTYEITNTGEETLYNLIVSDDKESGVVCPTSELQPGESIVCSLMGTAQYGPYQNMGRVSAVSASGVELVAVDPSHYLGVARNPEISIDLLVDGFDADSAPGPELVEQKPVEWTYVITNSGMVGLVNVEITDDQFGPIGCNISELSPGSSITCSYNGLAVLGPNVNTATVSAEGPHGQIATSTDSAHYLGVARNPSISIEKLTNGDDADLAPGPSIAEGEEVQWSFIVTNDGNVDLTQITVMDDVLGLISCPQADLSPGQSFTCNMQGIAVVGQHQNTATVSAEDQGIVVSNSDSSHYWGMTIPSIEIQKLTNGVDADDPPGPSILVGDPVEWTFIITNTGSIGLTQVALNDDVLGAITCPVAELAPGETTTCTLSGSAAYGQHVNTAVVTAQSTEGLSAESSDSSHYFGEPLPPEISLEKFTNGVDADDPPGPQIIEGDPIVWTFLIANTGPVEVSEIILTDDVLGLISCPVSELAPGETTTCSFSGTAVYGPHQNTATVTAQGPYGQSATDSDSSHYLGTALPPQVALEKYTNGFDADVAPGPIVNTGDTVTWTFTITNTGPVALTQIELLDDQIGVITCPSPTLQPGESMECSVQGTAQSGQYANIGTVSAQGPHGNEVSASDESHYFGFDANGAQGCSHGFWKNHIVDWQLTGFAPGHLLIDSFEEIAGYPQLMNDTLEDGLRYGGGPGDLGAAKILLRIATAALLNAAHPDVDYPYSVAAVVSLVDDALASHDRNAMLALKDSLEDLFEDCPLDGHSRSLENISIKPFSGGRDTP